VLQHVQDLAGLLLMWIWKICQCREGFSPVCPDCHADKSYSLLCKSSL